MQNRKIIHVDMDFFYAAIEIRDNPSLANRPVAVGGLPEDRSVLCTCNYIARQFGVRSAMPSAYALRLCPDLIIVPVNIQKYRDVSQVIHSVFREYTTEIEPLALDEAYLDVTHSLHHQGSATRIANEIRHKIFEKTKLTASAGVAPNKFLAKIASGWNKPNGQLVITPNDIHHFIKTLPIDELFGVGKVTAKKIHQMGIKTCLDLQKIPLPDLIALFGKLGTTLYHQCRGLDDRPVNPNRKRKSLSVEKTFRHDMLLSGPLDGILNQLFSTLTTRIEKYASNLRIKNQYIKIKMSNFKQHTQEKSTKILNYSIFEQLLNEYTQKEKGSIRLLGIGVHFSENDSCEDSQEVFIL